MITNLFFLNTKYEKLLVTNSDTKCIPQNSCDEIIPKSFLITI